MAQRDIVVIGGSAGSVEVLRELVGALPAGFPGSIFIVLHTSTTSDLPTVLRPKSSLPVEYAQDGERIKPGRVVVAPPERHLLLYEDSLLLSRGPRQNGVRPAIDPLFSSAAREFGNRVVAVILSGTLDDGCLGLRHVKDAQGLIIVQDPADAAWPDMPRNALLTVTADYCLPARQIVPQLIAAAGQPVKKRAPAAQPELTDEFQRAAAGHGEVGAVPRGALTTLTCPECGGTLWEKRQGHLLRFRCHTGHSYSSHSMLEANGSRVEEAMWCAVRLLKERVVLLRKLAVQAARHNQTANERQFLDRVGGIEQRIQVLVSVLLGNGTKAEAPKKLTA